VLAGYTVEQMIDRTLAVYEHAIGRLRTGGRERRRPG
jgi:hypothetical protein